MQRYQLPQVLAKSTVLECLTQIKQQQLINSELEVDGGNVSQIDSSGIALIIELGNWAKTNPQFKLTNLSPSIKNMGDLDQIKL